MDCEQLVGRMRSICDGTSGLPESVRAEYLALWERGELPQSPTACLYRGEAIDTLECESCKEQGKRVRIKVYQCPLYQRCVLMDGTQTRFCGTCESRLEKAAE